MNAAEFLLMLVRGWGLIGAAVALAFVTIGMGRIDEDSRGAYVFRPLIVPGVVLLWPLVAWRWWVLETGRDKWHLRHLPPRRSHGRVWFWLAIVIPLVFVTALAVRQDWPADAPPMRLLPAQESTK